MRWGLFLLLVLGLAVAAPSASAWAQASADEEVDRVALAARLIADGYWDRASGVLSEVDPDGEDVARSRFFTLRGLVFSHDGLHEQAIVDFRAALAEEDADPLVNLQLAQSLLTVDAPDEALAAIDDAGEVGDALMGSWLLRARAYQALDDLDGAWVALTRGEARFPDALPFPRQKVFLLVQTGLYQAALEHGRALLARTPDDPAAWLAISEALRNAERREEAILLLEEARLRFPLSADVATQLARLYLQTDRPTAAGDILRVAAEIDGKLFAATAESYRQAGKLDRALYYNGRVPDPVEKAKQRLGLYIEAGDWARATALEERLSRLGLLADDGLRYALAYAWFQLGDLARAEDFLKGITDPRVFRDATVLREAMQACADGGMGCL